MRQTCPTWLTHSQEMYRCSLPRTTRLALFIHLSCKRKDNPYTTYTRLYGFLYRERINRDI